MEVKKEEVKDESQIHIPKESIIKGEHYFEYISGTEVMCTKCPLGYGVTAGMEVKDGHIYIGEKLLV